jgi:hypothetical protein
MEKNLFDLKAKLQTKWRKVYRAIAKEDTDKSGKILC